MKKIDFNDYPSILWDESYEKDTEKLTALCQHISDYMIWGIGSYNNKNAKNDEELENIFLGKIDKLKDLYGELSLTFGLPGGPSKISDFKFFRKSFQGTNGTLLKIPFKVSATNVSQSSTDKRIDTQSSVLAAMLRNKAAAALSQESEQDLSFMRNQEEYVPSTVEKLMEFMNAPQQEEYAITRILTSLSKKYDVKSQELKFNRDHFVRGKMMAYINYHEGDPRIEHVHPDNFSWISPVEVDDIDDPNVTACSVSRFISIDNALRIYGDDLSSSSSINYLKKTIDGVRLGKGLRYNPSYYAGSSYNPYSDPFSLSFPEMARLEDGFDYAPKFYRLNTDFVHNSGYGACAILEQKVWFKVLKKVKSKLLVNGKNPSKEDISRYKSFPGSLDYSLSLVPDDYKAKDGEYIVYSPKEELMEFVRLGHCTFIRVRKCPYQIRTDQNISSVKIPAMMFISDEESIVSIGKELSVFYNSFMYKAKELRNIAGPDDILLLDELQLDRTKWASSLHNAAKTGTMWYNSSLVQSRENGDRGRHLSRVQLTPKVDSILKYFGACLEIEKIWEALVGQLNNAGAYDSAAKVNMMIEQSGLIIQKYFWEHYTFMTRCVRKWADVIKFYYARDGKLSVTFDKGIKEVLTLTKDMSLYDYETYMETGLKAIQDKDFIMARASEALSSGQLGFLDFVQMYLGDNVQESIAIIKRAAQEAKMSAQSAQESSMAMAQQKNQIDAEKMSIPLKVKEMDVNIQKYVADKRFESQQASNDLKMNKSDIDSQNRREEMLLSQDAEMEKMSLQEQYKSSQNKK